MLKTLHAWRSRFCHVTYPSHTCVMFGKALWLIVCRLDQIFQIMLQIWEYSASTTLFALSCCWMLGMRSHCGCSGSCWMDQEPKSSRFSSLYPHYKTVEMLCYSMLALEASIAVSYRMWHLICNSGV